MAGVLTALVTVLVMGGLLVLGLVYLTYRVMSFILTRIAVKAAREVKESLKEEGP